MSEQCPGCHKSYTDVKAHLERQPLCNQWIELNRKCPIAQFVNNQYLQKGDEKHNDEFICSTCNKSFSNLGNLNKHLNNNITCKKWNDYNELKTIKDYDSEYYTVDNPSEVKFITRLDLNNNDVPQTCNDTPKYFVESKSIQNIKLTRSSENTIASGKNQWLQESVLVGIPTVSEKMYKHIYNEEFVAPKYKLNHIIWNVFLIDKLFPLSDEIIKENNVGHIFAILPDEKEYDEHVKICVDHTVMEYHGHEMTMDVKLYDKCIVMMEALRKERINVFVFCNNGYQRSLPFLCYYLTKHHSDEVPSIEKAIDIILPQVDKENYAKERGKIIKSIEILFKVNGIS